MYFHAYDGASSTYIASSQITRAGADLRVSDNGSRSDFQHYSSKHAMSSRCNDKWEMRDAEISDDDYVHEEDDYDDEEEEPMDILYEQEVFDGGHKNHTVRRGSAGDILAHANIIPGQQNNHHHYRQNFHRYHSEPIHSSSLLSPPPPDGSSLELQISTFSDHLMALLQQEANIYSVPLPLRYYPTEFVEEVDDKKTTTISIGPWRKRIASWMFDVVDHFLYDRNVVSIALWYIDRYVGHLLVEEERNQRRGSGIESDSQPIKRRHFQLIAVTSLYLAIKVHGELKENDPVSGDEYDVVASLVHEVDGRAFLGKSMVTKEGKMDVVEDEEDAPSRGTDEDIRAVSQKINDLKRRHRMGRWSSRLSHFGLPLGAYPSVINNENEANSLAMAQSTSSARKVPKVPAAPHSLLPYKPRKRGMLSGPLRLHSFVELSRGLFTSKDITDTEMKILLSMNYVVNPPTSRRVVGELLRSVALSYCRVTGHSSIDTKETLESAAQRIFGFNIKEILRNILSSACQQIEGGTSKPVLSIGCLPSIVAYGAILNALDNEFKMIASCLGHNNSTPPQLEDFQRHYQRYSRAHSPSLHSASNIQTSTEEVLSVWKDEFLAMVYHATNGFLSPDSDDILKIRELLLDPIKLTLTSPSLDTSSPSNEETKQEGTKKRSPCSPRSILASSVLSRDPSLFASQTSSLSDSARLLSPYNYVGRSSTSSGAGSIRPKSFRSQSGGAVATATQPHRAYYKQMSDPVDTHRYNSSKYARAQTPDLSNYHISEQARQHMRSNQEVISCRTSMGEILRPPNPYPIFFSA